MSPRTLWLGLGTLTLALVAMLTAVSAPAEAAIAPAIAAPDIHGRAHPTRNLLAPAVAQASLDVTPVKAYYFAGDYITVTVRLTNLENFFGGELRWSFNATALEVVDMDPARANVQIQAGDLFPSGSIIAQPTGGQADNVNGKILFGGARLNQSAYNGDGTLAIVTFHVKSACNAAATHLALTSDTLALSNPAAESMPFTSDAEFTVQTPMCLFLPHIRRADAQ